MLEYLTLILICQLLGELTVGATGLPIPGPVVGMVLLFLFLMIRGRVPEELSTVTNGLLNNLSLMLIPAGVGVMVHFELLGKDVIPLSIALIVSTVLTICVTGIVMVKLNRRTTGITDSE